MSGDLQTIPRVLLADDNPEFLRACKSLLADDFDIVATAPDGSSALKAIRDLKPDVAVLDLAMPGLHGLEVTRMAIQEQPGLGVVICSIHRNIGQAAADAGARGYVFKPNLLRELVRVVKIVATGESALSLGLLLAMMMCA